MADNSKIEWTNATWNPVTGCHKVSAGCKNCYAERDWKRLSANEKTVYYGRSFNDVRTHEERLLQPLAWHKSRLIFVNSMSDLFHDDVPAEFIHEVFLTMAQARIHGHIFQILTKRPQRMREIVGQMDIVDIKARCDGSPVTLPEFVWPLPNVWLGVSVENQAAADERIPELLKIPAKVRFLSCEPLLGPIDLSEAGLEISINGLDEPITTNIHWVIAGGESGLNARPSHPDWFRFLRDQCRAADVPFFFKQWGEFVPLEKYTDFENRCYYNGRSAAKGIYREHVFTAEWRAYGDDDGAMIVPTAKMLRVGKKEAGRSLDGRTWDKMPVL